MARTAHSEPAGARAALLEQAAGWAFLYRLFRFPRPQQWAWLREARVGLAWRLLAAQLGGRLPARLPLPADFEEYREDFISTFEVGAPAPPCPLIESHWNRREPVSRVLHENILFYKQFGLALKSSGNETADHLLHQLEFMSYLCRMEADRPEHAPGIAAGRRDFLQRHLLVWTPRAAAGAEEARPGAWPAAWMALVAAYARARQPDRAS